MTRIILEFNDNWARLLDQLHAANIAIREGIQPGQRWGVVRDGRSYGISANEHSVRVYLQESEQEKFH